MKAQCTLNYVCSENLLIHVFILVLFMVLQSPKLDIIFFTFNLALPEVRLFIEEKYREKIHSQLCYLQFCNCNILLWKKVGMIKLFKQNHIPFCDLHVRELWVTWNCQICTVHLINKMATAQNMHLPASNVRKCSQEIITANLIQFLFMLLFFNVFFQILKVIQSCSKIANLQTRVKSNI